jgi:hypothetical protein
MLLLQSRLERAHEHSVEKCEATLPLCKDSRRISAHVIRDSSVSANLFLRETSRSRSARISPNAVAFVSSFRLLCGGIIFRCVSLPKRGSIGKLMRLNGTGWWPKDPSLIKQTFKAVAGSLNSRGSCLGGQVSALGC